IELREGDRRAAAQAPEGLTDGRLTIALAQLDLLVGDIDGNAARVQDTAAQLGTAPSVVDLVVFPELTLAGYPPEDLLFHRGFRHQIERALERCTRTAGQPAMLLGFPEYTDAGIYNSVALLASGVERARYRKTCLPNYGVFDEQRYFARGDAPLVIESSGFRLGILICEDIWQRDPAQAARVAGAELLLVTNASPYEQGKQAAREAMLRERAIETGLPIVYVNLVGAQDELVFDGQSVVVDRHGNVVLRAAAFVEALATIEFTRDADGRAVPRAAPDAITPPLAEAEEVYRALVQGVRDYVGKHRFPGVVLGLSGGIDSALTLAIAVDALGAERVQAVMMPSRYTAQMSLDDAALQASRLGVKYSVIPIED
ncbi:MAG: NAD+ synthase, partial [Oxalobacteraceae bacterium]|nr:NAD+ synthase [Oxalobacteraceae bacterium]